MPTKMLIINPFLIFLYILIFNCLSKNKIILIIAFNLLPWFFSYNILEIKYKNQKICYAKEAIDASVSFSFAKGNLIQYINPDNNLTKCFSAKCVPLIHNLALSEPLAYQHKLLSHINKRKG